MQNALARVDVERRRAERAAVIAERHERQLLTDTPGLREFHLKMATMHRRVQRQHLAAAAMHAAHARRLRTWIGTPQRHNALPRFMASVAGAAGVGSAALTLFGPGLVETLSTASDRCAKAAQDLEFTLGEGPARDAMAAGIPVQAIGSAIRRRWPHYGPAVQRLGVATIAATPVELTGVPLGALTLFDQRRRCESDCMDNLQAVADSVAGMLVPADNQGNLDGLGDLDDPGGLPVRAALLAEGDSRAIVHQATGMVSVQQGCLIQDAFALIQARAFAEDRPMESIAKDIVEHTLRLD